MHAWISHIDAISGKTITVRAPDSPHSEALDLLRPHQVALMLQLIIHRQLTEERFARIAPLDGADLRHEIDALWRTGFIERHHEVLSVNPFLEPHLIQRFAEAQQI